MRSVLSIIGVLMMMVPQPLGILMLSYRLYSNSYIKYGRKRWDVEPGEQSYGWNQMTFCGFLYINYNF